MIDLDNFSQEKRDYPTLYKNFWNWFLKNETYFYDVIKKNQDVENLFLNVVNSELLNIKMGLFSIVGMREDDIAEFIVTADGSVENFVFIEELMQAAPILKNWSLEALKSPIADKDFDLELNGLHFNESNLFFYSNDDPNYPDEIDITVLYEVDKNYEDDEVIYSGTYSFLDNYLGELDFACEVDNLQILRVDEAEKELVPISKLKAFINWRKKEFVEKNEGTLYDTEKDEYLLLEGEYEEGYPIFLALNTVLLNWDAKASHPWITIFYFYFDGSKSKGLPSNEEFELLNNIENKLMSELKDFEGYLSIGRQTGNDCREVYYACKDFRKPSRLFQELVDQYDRKFTCEFEIIKDKYWRTYDRFTNY